MDEQTEMELGQEAQGIEQENRREQMLNETQEANKQLRAKIEKLETAIRGALAIKKLWLYPLSKSITIQQRDEGRALWIMEKQFEQAL